MKQLKCDKANAQVCLTLSAMRQPDTSVFILLCLVLINAEEAKIRFLEGSDRPIQDPAKTSHRRMLDDGTNPHCIAIGNTAGALTAKILIKEGMLTSKRTNEDEDDDNRAIVDVGTFMTMAVRFSANTLGFNTSCPAPVITEAAAHMCQVVLCRTPDKQNSAVASASVSDFFSNVRRSMPKLSDGRKCDTQYFRFNLQSSIMFNSNPEGYIKNLTKQVAELTLETLYIQKKQKLKPLEAPPKVADKNLDYFLSTVSGATIASFVSKELAALGEIKNSNVQGSLDLTKLISKIVEKILPQLRYIPKKSYYKVSNAAIKLSLFWLVNNCQLVRKTHLSSLTSIALTNLGLVVNGESESLKLKTNNEPVDSRHLYIVLKEKLSKKKLLRKILAIIPCEDIRKDILRNVRGKVPEASDDAIRLVYEPVTSVKSMIVATNAATTSSEESERKVGMIPQPQLWYSTKTPINGQNFDVILTGALSAIIGSHSAEILPKFGLITIDDEPGYQNLESIDIYEVIQEINMKLTAKLMMVLPFSLKTGFQIVTGAFKATKFALNLKDLPNNYGRGKSSMYIPLAFKKFGISEFFADLQHLELDLIPLPLTNKPLRLWAKGYFDVNTHVLIQERLEVLVDKEISNVLKDVISIFSVKIPGFSIFMLDELQQKLKDIFTWDPPDIMSFIFEPPTVDGILDEPNSFKELPKRPLQCPGHYLCSDDGTARIPVYSCTTLDPWCYFPNNFTCPSDIHCPVELMVKGQQLICPDDPNCPVINVICPGHPECPDETTICPGNPSCPLEVKCPGRACPQRFTTKSQFLLPCPFHSQCNQQPIRNQLICTNALTCTYSNLGDMHNALLEMEQNIINAIKSKNLTVNVETKAIANVMIVNKPTNSGSSDITVDAGASSTTSVLGDMGTSSSATANVNTAGDKASSTGTAASDSGGKSSAASAAASEDGEKSSSAAAAAAASNGGEEDLNGIKYTPNIPESGSGSVNTIKGKNQTIPVVMNEKKPSVKDSSKMPQGSTKETKKSTNASSKHSQPGNGNQTKQSTSPKLSPEKSNTMKHSDENCSKEGKGKTNHLTILKIGKLGNEDSKDKSTSISKEIKNDKTQKSNHTMHQTGDLNTSKDSPIKHSKLNSDSLTNSDATTFHDDTPLTLTNPKEMENEKGTLSTKIVANSSPDEDYADHAAEEPETVGQIENSQTNIPMGPPFKIKILSPSSAGSSNKIAKTCKEAEGYLCESSEVSHKNKPSAAAAGNSKKEQGRIQLDTKVPADKSGEDYDNAEEKPREHTESKPKTSSSASAAATSYSTSGELDGTSKIIATQPKQPVKHKNKSLSAAAAASASSVNSKEPETSPSTTEVTSDRSGEIIGNSQDTTREHTESTPKSSSSTSAAATSGSTGGEVTGPSKNPSEYTESKPTASSSASAAASGDSVSSEDGGSSKNPSENTESKPKTSSSASAAASADSTSNEGERPSKNPSEHKEPKPRTSSSAAAAASSDSTSSEDNDLSKTVTKQPTILNIIGNTGSIELQRKPSKEGKGGRSISIRSTININTPEGSASTGAGANVDDKGKSSAAAAAAAAAAANPGAKVVPTEKEEEASDSSYSDER